MHDDLTKALVEVRSVKVRLVKLGLILKRFNARTTESSTHPSKYATGE